MEGREKNKQTNKKHTNNQKHFQEPVSNDFSEMKTNINMKAALKKDGYKEVGGGEMFS